MKQASQLTRLIWDYYRENPQELNQLTVLENCKVYRRWGVFHIQCFNLETAEMIALIHPLIREPIFQMRLAQKLKVSVKNLTTIAVFNVKPDRIMA